MRERRFRLTFALQAAMLRQLLDKSVLVVSASPDWLYTALLERRKMADP